MKKTKQALLQSTIALILCFSMLIGTTFAWFTDEVTSGSNIIQSGKLNVEMYWTDDLSTGVWYNAEKEGENVPFNYDKWEPGYTEVRYVKIVNAGNLALKYSLTLGAVGKVGKLAEVIGVHYAENVAANIADRSLEGMKSLGVLADAMNGGEAAKGSLEPGKETVVAVALHMDEEAGNEYQNETIGDGFVFKLLATQFTSESDSFGADYDENAEWPYVSIKYVVSQSIADKIDAATGDLTEAVMIGKESDAQYAQIPADVKLADGAKELTFTVTSMEKPNADVSTSTRDEILRSVDIHVDGIAEDNTVPMTFVLKELFPKGLNQNNVKLYHVENGQTKEMTVVDAPANHNEFSYDPLTGDAVITIATFSEVATYADTDAGWNGTTVTPYTDEGDTIKIANAEQFAYFRNQVDGGNDFAGKTVLLTADINLNDHSFDPIGWGYDNAAWNRDEKAGKVFKGHFNGDYHTIYGLRQNCWELDPDKEKYSNYTYTNCGGGLFASALDATFENLTIDGADIIFECVEIGVLVGLAQGNCTFNNINILGCKIANYQRPAGGVVGEVSPKVVDGVSVESTHTFKNVYVDSNTIVGSLWGDFDAPVGGVIGAYWDDAGKTSVSMTDVTVACELDVYNDVTSTYQWYAYRRAGMLIGNTDRVDSNDAHKAAATYLTCSNVTVYYGEWADYHYCEFNEANEHWPWVRVEPGENCEGYSNPRWGRPIDSTTGEPVTDSVHEHGENEGHLVSIPFHQLYGGGQGVYGQATHNGVSEGIYTVTYMDHGEVLHVDYVTDNKVAYDCDHVDGTGIWPITNVKDANGNSPTHWVKGDNTEFTGVGIGNTANIVVYPKWPNEYTIRCLDTYGDVAYYAFVTDDTTTDEEYKAIATEINNTLISIQNEVDADKKVMVIVWQNGDSTLTSVTADDIENSVMAGSDFILEAIPQLQTTSITLEKVYDETTNELIAYRVAEVNQNDTNSNVVIPDYVGKIPVTEIKENAAAGFANLHSVTIPETVDTIGVNAFADGGSFGTGETVTIYFEGTMDDWKNSEKITKNDGWDNGIGTGSRIFFLKNGKVDVTQGYLEVTSKGGFFGQGATYDWTEKTVDQALIDQHLGYCDCSADPEGDTSHIYVDANGNVLEHDADGTPVNSEGTAIYLKESGWLNKTYKLTDGTVDTYKRYRPDKAYWEGVTIAE